MVAPEVRFLWNRVTPGGLGLELTTTLAIGGVGMYVFALYVVILSGDPGLTPLDQELLDLADRPAVAHADRRRQGGHRPRRVPDLRDRRRRD